MRYRRRLREPDVRVRGTGLRGVRPGPVRGRQRRETGLDEFCKCAKMYSDCKLVLYMLLNKYMYNSSAAKQV